MGSTRLPPFNRPVCPPEIEKDETAKQVWNTYWDYHERWWNQEREQEQRNDRYL